MTISSATTPISSSTRLPIRKATRSNYATSRWCWAPLSRKSASISQRSKPRQGNPPIGDGSLRRQAWWPKAHRRGFNRQRAGHIAQGAYMDQIEKWDLTVKIRRFNPDVNKKPYWQTFHIAADPMHRFVDVLNEIKWTQDGTLTFRRSCVHGVCGSDSMRLNGRNMLACKTLVQDLGTKISVEPMLGFPVIKDLVVDMDPFFANYEKIKPFLVNDEPAPHTE